MTECTQETFSFAAHFSRRVEAGFSAGHVSSDGGWLLLREVDGRINLLARLAGCFRDGRNPEQVEHPVSEMLSQRIYGLALGYEDLNDHERLRSDPIFAVLSGRRKLEEPLAGKSTLNRLELVGRTGRYHKIGYSAEAIDRLLVDLYIESHTAMPERIVLDLDATDIPLYGHQPDPTEARPKIKTPHPQGNHEHGKITNREKSVLKATASTGDRPPRAGDFGSPVRSGDGEVRSAGIYQRDGWFCCARRGIGEISEKPDADAECARESAGEECF
jgi:Transposase DDE domain group 1